MFQEIIGYLPGGRR